jgi:hypothetical protein
MRRGLIAIFTFWMVLTLILVGGHRVLQDMGRYQVLAPDSTQVVGAEASTR